MVAVSEKYNGTTVTTGLFIADIAAVMNSAKSAGAKEISHTQDYEYGYRQGQIKRPFRASMADWSKNIKQIVMFYK